ncbi:odontogenic ameloblast-associated protein isoform X1 [Latimeria chalumnae]|uniref:odontogenic ameloblast-associated protein isoform X1 n=1 Tax=Latimeria chalumnae TaxID=7897 RepID=UPI0003C14605
MKTLVLVLCLVSTACAFPILQQRVLSASNSNEMLRSVGFLPIQPQGPVLPFGINPLPPQVPLLPPQVPLLPPQVPFLPQNPFPPTFPFFPQVAGSPQAPQVDTIPQLDPLQPQPPQQPQEPNQVLPFFYALGFPQQPGQGQRLPYVPMYMYPQQQYLFQQSAQQPPQSIPFYNQFGYVPQQVGNQQAVAQARPEKQHLVTDAAPTAAPQEVRTVAKVNDLIIEEP